MTFLKWQVGHKAAASSVVSIDNWFPSAGPHFWFIEPTCFGSRRIPLEKMGTSAQPSSYAHPPARGAMDIQTKQEDEQTKFCGACRERRGRSILQQANLADAAVQHLARPEQPLLVLQNPAWALVVRKHWSPLC